VPTSGALKGRPRRAARVVCVGGGRQAGYSAGDRAQITVMADRGLPVDVATLRSFRMRAIFGAIRTVWSGSRRYLRVSRAANGLASCRYRATVATDQCERRIAA
jgi:hypothetical protein